MNSHEFIHVQTVFLCPINLWITSKLAPGALPMGCCSIKLAINHKLGARSHMQYLHAFYKQKKEMFMSRIEDAALIACVSSESCPSVHETGGGMTSLNLRSSPSPSLLWKAGRRRNVVAFAYPRRSSSRLGD
jgi:hypothetical protein